MIILGGTGMLGSMMVKVTGSPGTIRAAVNAEMPEPKWFENRDRMVNCIGLIKPYCEDPGKAIRVNALFPHYLPAGSIQIATDCVYSGQDGLYIETDPHDALDVYGKTKSLGEAPHLNNLRCSVIGPEEKNHLSLLDWFLSQEDTVNGFTNHFWNGVTSYHFAKIVEGIIRENIQLPVLQHIIPADSVTKSELLQIIATVYKKDITIREVETPTVVNRTLATTNPALNLRLWRAAGYDQPPTIEQMVKELSLKS
jgi:dTDP-4-dehydrorhamnose reductase